MSCAMKTITMNSMITGQSRSMSMPPPVMLSKTMKMNMMTSLTTRCVPPLVVTRTRACAFRASSTPATNPETEFVKKTVSSHNIVIFSKSYCPYCETAKGVFKELNQSPHVIELDQRDDGSSLQDALSKMVGRRTVPQVFVKGEHVGGSDDTVEAYESGKLAKLLAETNDDL